MFLRVGGMHDFSRGATKVAESTDIVPGSYFVVLCRGRAWEVPTQPGEGASEAYHADLVGRLRAIAAHPPPDPAQENLSLCTHVYDRSQPALRERHRDYFEQINQSLFTVSLFPDESPTGVSQLATRHFAHPESCWHDKGVQLVVYGNGKATILVRTKNDVLGSSVAKTASAIQRGATGLDVPVGPAPARVAEGLIAHPALSADERAICRHYAERHAVLTEQSDHIRQIHGVGRRSFGVVGDQRIRSDAVFQACLHAAYERVFGEFPLAMEAVYTGHLDGAVSASQEFSGTLAMPRLSELIRRRLLDESTHSEGQLLEIVRQGAAKPAHIEVTSTTHEIRKLLAETSAVHERTLDLARGGYLLPNRCFAWLRSWAFRPVIISKIVTEALLPRPLRGARAFGALKSLASKTPILGKLLAVEPVDIVSSHFPAAAGTVASAMQNLRLYAFPSFLTPEMWDTGRVSGVYRGKMLVHYNLHVDYTSVSALCFSPAAVARRTEFLDALDESMRLCAEACAPLASRPEPATTQDVERKAA